MDKIYSRSFLLQTRNLDLCLLRSEILTNIDLRVVVAKQPPPFIPNESKSHYKRGGRGRKEFKPRDNDWRSRPKLTRGKDAWVPDHEDKEKKPKTDIKKIRGILNKLSENNKESLLAETQAIEYTDPEVVSIIFKKAVAEPFFSELYAQFCLGLTNLHELIRCLCTEEFGKIRNKNLCRFVGELYKLRLIEDLESFVDFLKEDLNDKNLEILCELIITVNPKDPQFSPIISELYEHKANYSTRLKFMIMDVYDFKIGKRKPKQQRATIKNKSEKIAKERALV